MYVFAWDENKNQINRLKHGIDFQEASSVFFDEQAILFDDPEHSNEDEERFLLLGMSETTNICMVCHCYRENDTVIRIISARKATKKEVNRYVRGI